MAVRGPPPHPGGPPGTEAGDGPRRDPLRTGGARRGAARVATKPIGTGLVINGRRKGLTADADLAAALESMAALNQAASELALAHGAHAVTDVTGFGLVGHAAKMVRGAGI